MGEFTATTPARLDPQGLIALVWIGVTAAGVVLSLIPPMDGDAVAKQIATSCCGLALSAVVTALGTRTLGWRVAWMRAALAGLVVLAGTALWLLDSWFQTLPSGHALSVRELMSRRYNIVYFTLLFGLQALILVFIASTRAAARQQRQLVEAQLAALRFQVNPHFLFNTLNALSGLVEEGATEVAGETIARLADFLRITLAEEAQALVPLARELETVQSYLAIEDVRFGDRLRVRYDADHDTGDDMVPSLILQPLVENAIKHAVGVSTGDAAITIGARREDGELVLTVEDRLSERRRRPHPGGAGVGLRNVAARLHALYGDPGRLETCALENGFVATIRIPRRAGKGVA